MDLVVMKFGGTSVQDVTALRRLIDIVRTEPRPKVVVVSALAGVTDTLSALGTCQRAGHASPHARQVTEALCERHVEIVRAMVPAAAQEPLVERLRLRFGAAAALAEATCGMTRRDRDALLAIGELASSEVVAAVLTHAGAPAVWADARHAIVTDAAFGHARPDPACTREAAGSLLRPLLAAGKVPVIGGFVGATVDGLTTTLGRGGSDYSAALLGAALDAREIQIWTDVDGVLTGDPRIIADAVPVPRLTFREAYELARFGAKVLHWGTLQPAAVHDIPLRVLNAARPGARGTTISATGSAAEKAVAGLAYQPVAHVADLAPVAVTGCFDFVRAATDWLERNGREATVISLSPSGLVVAAPDERTIGELVASLAAVACVRAQYVCEPVAVVGGAAAASPLVWLAVDAQRSTGRLHEAIPAQSGDAVVCLALPGAGARLFADLHAALVHHHVPARRSSSLPSLPPSTDTHIGTQSIDRREARTAGRIPSVPSHDGPGARSAPGDTGQLAEVAQCSDLKGALG